VSNSESIWMLLYLHIKEENRNIIFSLIFKQHYLLNKKNRDNIFSRTFALQKIIILHFHVQLHNKKIIILHFHVQLHNKKIVILYVYVYLHNKKSEILYFHVWEVKALWVSILINYRYHYFNTHSCIQIRKHYIY
jgi:hypothetical protein